MTACLLSSVKGLFAQQTLYNVVRVLKGQRPATGRPQHLSPLEQAVLFLFKLRYNLPDRVLEAMFGIDHVTASRAFNRALAALSAVRAPLPTAGAAWYAVDTTTLRIGRGRGKTHFTGYKHLSGIKLQLVVNDQREVVDVSPAHPASAHDYRIFVREWHRLAQKLDRAVPLLADKAYIGLHGLTQGQIQVPLKRGTRRQAAPTVDALSSKRVRVEHVFARLKVFRALANSHFHHSRITEMATVILNWLIR